MKISCPSCSAKYSLADEKVQDRLAKIRCRKCGTTIVIDGKVSPPTVQAADGTKSEEGETDQAEEGPTGDQYTVDVSESDQRNMTVAEIVAAYNDGTLTADTYVWKDGMADWEPLADVAELNAALHKAAGSPAPAAAVPSATEAEPEMDLGFKAASLSPEPAKAVAAAAVAVATKPVATKSAGATLGAASPVARAATASATAPRGAAADLFGSIDTVGSEQDVMTSALGGGASEDATAQTGARNESSVLFSLSALTSSETKDSGASSKVTEDSGLIDLAALTAAASPTGGGGASALDLGAAPLGAAPLGGSPLGGAPFASPLAGGGVAAVAPLGVETAPTQGGNKTGMFIGGGIAIAAIVLGGMFMLKDPPPVAPAVATVVVTAPAPVPEAPTKVAEATDTKEPEETAKDPEQQPEAVDTTAAAAGKPKAPATWKPKKPAAPAPAKPPSAPVTKKPDPPADKPKPAAKPKCNCKPNDLMCAMKCSTK